MDEDELPDIEVTLEQAIAGHPGVHIFNQWGQPGPLWPHGRRDKGDKPSYLFFPQYDWPPS